MTLSTHVLDAARGGPAAGVGVELWHRDGQDWALTATTTTDSDGRADELTSRRPIDAGVHRLVFATGAYFSETGQRGFYPEVTVTFEVTDPGAHYHVPLLLAPFSYSTYRGS